MGLNLIHKNVDVHQHSKADDPDIGEVDHQHPLVDNDMFRGPYPDKKNFSDDITSSSHFFLIPKLEKKGQNSLLVPNTHVRMELV